MNRQADWIIVPNCHEAIVNNDEYTSAQSAIARKPISSGHENKRDYLLRSLLACGECGRALCRKETQKGAYYKCVTSITNPAANCSNENHYAEQVLEQIVVSSFLNTVRLFVEREALLKDTAAKTDGTEENLRAQLLKLDQAAKRTTVERMTAYECYSDGKMIREDFMALRESLTQNLCLDMFSDNAR